MTVTTKTQKVENRKARHDYEVIQTLKAGIALEGWEVKAAMAGHATFQGSSAFVRFSNGEAWLEGMVVTPLLSTADGLLGTQDPVRSRKLLLTRQELDKLQKKVLAQGMTVVPLTLEKERKFKVTIALVKGRNKADKREKLKNADVERDIRNAQKSSAQRAA